MDYRLEMMLTESVDASMSVPSTWSWCICEGMRCQELPGASVVCRFAHLALIMSPDSTSFTTDL
jgi:hypothetical protein